MHTEQVVAWPADAVVLGRAVVVRGGLVGSGPGSSVIGSSAVVSSTNSVVVSHAMVVVIVSVSAAVVSVVVSAAGVVVSSSSLYEASVVVVGSSSCRGNNVEVVSRGRIVCGLDGTSTQNGHPQFRHGQRS